jgi:hypothetical protein
LRQLKPSILKTRKREVGYYSGWLCSWLPTNGQVLSALKMDGMEVGTKKGNSKGSAQRMLG